MDHVLFTLKRSKPDRNHEGVNIVLAATNDAACPVEGLSKLFRHDSQPTTPPLFTLSSGPFASSALQGAVISKLNRAGEDNTGLKGHSFRKGAAQHAFDAGLRNDHIQALGRWSSKAFRPPLLHDTYNNTVRLEPSIPDRPSYHQPLHHPLLAHRVIWARLQSSPRCSPPSTRPTSPGFRSQVPRLGQTISFVSICASVAMLGIEDLVHHCTSEVSERYDIPYWNYAHLSQPGICFH